MYFKRWKIFTAQPLNRLKYTDPLKCHHFSQGFDWECWILKKSKEKLSINWKNQGRPTKSEIIFDRVIIFWITPI